MMDEIERLQAKQSSGEDFEENDEKHLNELQQLADQEDTDGESSDDDWKQEGRKISEELSRANEQSSEEEVDMIEPLSADDIERVKQEVLRAAMKHILMKVTDDLTGKICQKSIATVQPPPAINGLGGLIGYADSDSDEEEEDDKGSKKNETDNNSNGEISSGFESVTSGELRVRRKRFEKRQKRRLKLLELKRGSDDELSDDSDSSQNSTHHHRRRSRSRSKHRHAHRHQRHRDSPPRNTSRDQRHSSSRSRRERSSRERSRRKRSRSSSRRRDK